MNFEAARALRQKLRSGQPSIGAWQTLASPTITEIFSASQVDWVMIDMEHSMLDLADVANSIRIIDLMGKVAFVRPPELDGALIKRLLEGLKDKCDLESKEVQYSELPSFRRFQASQASSEEIKLPGWQPV